MPVRLLFRCQFCAAEPDPETRRSLEEEALDMEWGQYTDALPSGWLVWHGKGIYGPTRYACADCRIKLRDYVRYHYGTIGWHPHARVLGNVPQHVHDQMKGRPPRVGNRTPEQRRARMRRSGGFAA